MPAIEVLVKFGADVNRSDESGWTAVFRAAEEGRDAAVAALLKAGADLNAADKDGSILASMIKNMDKEDSWKLAIETLIAAAVGGGLQSCIEALAKAGADVNRSN